MKSKCVLTFKGGTTKFNPINTFKINGKDPPVITVGCGWNYDQNGFDYHAGKLFTKKFEFPNFRENY